MAEHSRYKVTGRQVGIEKDNKKMERILYKGLKKK